MRWVDGQFLEQQCPVCGQPGAKAVRLEVPSPFPGRGRRRLLDCSACTSEFFDDQSLPPDYYEDNDAAVKFYIEQGASIEDMIWPLLRIPAERITSVADIGCGFGFALDFARTALGCRVRGIDRSALADRGARVLGLDIVAGYFESPQSLGGETFDVVLTSEVIEHVPDPNRFVRDVASILEPRGTAIFTTPNAAAVRRERPVSDLLRILSPGFHLVLFTARSLRVLLERAGFAHVEVEEEADHLRAYASRIPLDLARAVSPYDGPYRAYLTARGDDERLDVDVRIGLKYRHFRTLVSAGAWHDATAQFAELRGLVRQRYAFDLDAPETIPTFEPVSFEVTLDPYHANAYFEQFVGHVPCNIVGLLYFRGALALSVGKPRDALEFLRAASAIGVAARSIRKTHANEDGEIAELLKRSFLLAVLARAGLSPEDALIDLARILDDDPPAGVPRALWVFPAPDRQWLLGALFTYFVDRGHAGAAEIVFARLRDHILAAYGVDLTQPDAAPAGGPSAGWDPSRGKERRCEAALFGQSCSEVARIFLARGLLDLQAGHAVDAYRYFSTASDLARAGVGGGDDVSDPNGERAAVFVRIQIHTVLALAAADPDAALVRLRQLLGETPPPDVPPILWKVAGRDRAALLWNVFVRLVNEGEYSLAVCLVPDVQAALGAVDGEGPDPARLASSTDPALDATFCRAMLAVNHERAYQRAAGWFHIVYEAACERWQRGVASPSATGLLWTARYHEALSLVLAGDTEAAAPIIESMTRGHGDTRPPVPASLVGAVHDLLPDPPTQERVG